MLDIIHKCHAYNKVFFLNLISWHSIHPFNLILVGLTTFPSLRWLQDRTVLTESPIIHSSINHLSGGFMNFVKQI